MKKCLIENTNSFSLCILSASYEMIIKDVKHRILNAARQTRN